LTIRRTVASIGNGGADVPVEVLPMLARGEELTSVLIHEDIGLGASQ
jgi:hypothetical protein